MRRGRSSWVLVLAALVASGAALLVWQQMRPNPIVVRLLEPGGLGSDVVSEAAIPALAARPQAPALTEVEVARERAIAMEMKEMPVVGPLAAPGETLVHGDPAAVAAELRELRTALDAWLAAPGRCLRISQTWYSEETSSFLGFALKRVRVGLHASLVPATSSDR